jgi:Skp family chaperone for outer membrane proteins
MTTHTAPVTASGRVGLALLLLTLAVVAAAADEPQPAEATVNTEQRLLDQVQALQRQLEELTSTRDQEIEEIKKQLVALEEALWRLQEQRSQD